jgi:hypothetical protein
MIEIHSILEGNKISIVISFGGMKYFTGDVEILVEAPLEIRLQKMYMKLYTPNKISQRREVLVALTLIFI